MFTLQLLDQIACTVFLKLPQLQVYVSATQAVEIIVKTEVRDYLNIIQNIY